MLLWWGPDYIQFYNDAYRPIPGAKHPTSMGQPGRECWAEIWHILQPLVDTPFHGGPATWMEDIFLEINRYGFMEETHFTIAYSAVSDDSVPRGIGGVLATVHEITGQVVGERRLGLLRDLGAHAPEAKTASEACLLTAEILARYPSDIPFALLYLIDDRGERAHLAGAAGIPMGEASSPLVVDVVGGDAEGVGWGLADVLHSETLTVVDDLAHRFASVPPGPWSDPPHRAVVVPIRSNKAHALAGLMVSGVSARLPLDERYRSFFELVATQIATAVANARAYEEERRRAEALAEIDRAKTLFFSNVSHEFRTPLTLMMAPVRDVLADTTRPLDPAHREALGTAHRNSLRLLRLVNTLLDFSRIEAGRSQATYEAVDLSVLTAEIASNFRSACEKAGLQLSVICDPLPEVVYVDRDMWEKVVLNLLSNAFKFTFAGEIEVTLTAGAGAVELRVRDTGTGIPEEEMPRLFERFHRVHGAHARTTEGTGIGLALVQELVKLHGGSIRERRALTGLAPHSMCVYPVARPICLPIRSRQQHTQAYRAERRALCRGSTALAPGRGVHEDGGERRRVASHWSACGGYERSPAPYRVVGGRQC
jgi:signal transduction histidine kinase